jgi:hypothetical protein
MTMKQLALALILLATPAHALTACTDPSAVVQVFADSQFYIWDASGNLAQQVDTRCASTWLNAPDVGRGTQTAGWSGVAPMTTYPSLLTANSPTHCLIELGTNDFAASLSVEQSIANLEWYAVVCEQAGATPILLTTWPMNDGFSQMRQSWMGDHRHRLLALGAAHSWAVIDMWKPYSLRTWPTDCTWNGSAYDGVHPRTCLPQTADYLADALP